MQTMSEIIKELLLLSEIDRRILRGKTNLHNLAKEVSDQENAVNEARNLIRQTEGLIKNKALDADKTNMDIRSHEGELQQQEKKLKAIKNQKEYRILTDRIKELKILVDQGESDVLADMEELDKLRELMTKHQQAVGEADLKLTSLRQEAQKKGEQIKQNHAEMLKERQILVDKIKKISGEAYLAYDLSLKRTKGDAMAEMSSDGVCQSCFRRQNSNILNIVHIGSDIKNCLCQGCGRVLYTRSANQTA